MAKGDASRAQNQINYQGGLAQNTLGNVQSNVGSSFPGFKNAYTVAQGMQIPDYQNIMDTYKGINQGIAGQYQPILSQYADIGSGRVGGVGLDNTNVDQAIGGFKGFADTGGFSSGDIQDIRARAISPTRSIYSSAQANIDRQRGLSGGYAPNAIAAQGQLARQAGQQISDADIAANANIAQMVQQGKLYGLTGLSNAALQQQANALQAAGLSNQMRLGGLSGWSGAIGDMIGRQLGGAQGMTGLYSATPGLMGTTGQQLLGQQGQMLEGAGLQNQLGLGLIGAQIGKSQIPGDFQQAMGNIGSGLGLVGNIAGSLGGFGGGMSPQVLPSRATMPNLGYLPG